MKKSRFTTEQIVFALRQAEAGLGVEETCRKLGISFYRYLGDRLRVPGAEPIPPLPDLVRRAGSPA